jgi:O-antigen ligase
MLKYLERPRVQLEVTLLILIALLSVIFFSLKFGTSSKLSYFVVAGSIGLLLVPLIFYKFNVVYMLLLFIIIRPAIEVPARGGIYLGSEAFFNPLSILSIYVVVIVFLFVLINISLIQFDRILFYIMIFVFLTMLWGAINTLSFFNYIVSETRLILFFLIFIVFSRFGLQIKDIHKRIFYVFLISFLIPCVVALYQYKLDIGFKTEWVPSLVGLTRIYGTLSHPNVLSRIALMCIILSVAGLINLKSKHIRVALVILLVVALFVLYHTFTRSSWISCAIVISLIFALNKRFSLLAVWLLLILAIVISTPNLSKRFSDIVSVNYRINVWATLISYMNIVELIVGKGLGSASYITNQVYKITQPHNDYLRIFVDTGLVGTYIYFSILLQFLVIAIRCRTLNLNPYERVLLQAFIASLVSVLFISFFDNLMRSVVDQMYLWTLAGLNVGIYNREFGSV